MDQPNTKQTEAELRRRVQDEAAAYYRAVHDRSGRAFKPGDAIPYAGRVFDETEIAYLMDASLDFWLTAGWFSTRFEKELARYLGVNFANLTNSGSSSNLAAFMTLTSPRLKERRIKRGDEVITVACGFPTTVAPIVQYGAVPVFVDVDATTGNVDVSQLEAARSDKTRAVMLAHTLGNPFDLTAVLAFCEKHNLWLIEDNCDALGARFELSGETRFTGTFGDLSTFSFYPAHHITMGEGGAVATMDPRLNKILMSVRDWGRDCWCPPGKDNTCQKRFAWSLGDLPYGYDHKYTYSHFGYNLKPTDLQAAIGCAQLQKLPGFIEARKRNRATLYEGLKDLSDRFVFQEATPGADPSWFGFLMTIRPEFNVDRRDFTTRLEAKGIQTRVLFAGNMVRQPCFKEFDPDGTSYRIVGSLENSDRIMERAFWVGVYPGLTEPMLAYMIETIRTEAQTLTKRGS